MNIPVRKMTLSLPNTLLVIGIFSIFVSALLQHTRWDDEAIAVSHASILIFYLAFATGNSTQKYVPFLGLFILLFAYSLVMSQFVSRSALVSVNAFSSFLFACTILDLHSNKFREVIKKALIFVLISVVSVHCFTLIYNYTLNPIRATGLLNDYSQASMLILIAFGFTYSRLKSIPSVLSFFIVFMAFLGFFTTFSRSANFLLIVFLLALLLLEKKNNNVKYWLGILGVILLSFIVVQIVPWIVGSELVSRGGLNHFSTLNSRTIYWQAAAQSISANPLWGTGLGTFEWSGIKQAIPFAYISNVHNDYLQWWLEVGIVWTVVLIGLQVKFLLKYCPIKLSLPNILDIKIKASDHVYISWIMLVLISAYMLINFIVGFLLFQLLIAMLVVDVIHDE